MIVLPLTATEKKGAKEPLGLLNLVFLRTPLRHTVTPSGCDALYLSTKQQKNKLALLPAGKSRTQGHGQLRIIMIRSSYNG
jgi:hypothetical protein